MDPFKRNRIIGLTLGFIVLTTILMAVIAILYYFKTDHLAPIERAKVMLKDAPLVDGQNNLASSIRKLIFNDLRKVDFLSNLSNSDPWKSLITSQTDLLRLKEGHVGLQIWVARASCDSQYKDAVAITLEQIDVIKRFIDAYSDEMMLVTNLEEIKKAKSNGKIASLIAVGSSISIQSSLSVLRQYYDLGVRVFQLAGACNTPWIDNSKVDHSNKSVRTVSLSHGISSFGEDIVKEMNRIGMIIDLSHSSIGAVKDVLTISKAPVIFSHTAARTLCDVDSNIFDGEIKITRQKDGLIMVNFDSAKIKCDGSEATIDDFIKHLNHIKSRATADNIGIGSNFDAIEKPVRGLEDVSKFPELFATLIESGEWEYDELEKLAGVNFLRVMEEVEHVKQELKDMEPMQTYLKRVEVKKHWDKGNCTSSTAFDSYPNLEAFLTYPKTMFGL